MEKEKNEALTKRPALVLEMESVIISGATENTNSVCVLSHGKNLHNQLHRGWQDFFQYNM